MNRTRFSVAAALLFAVAPLAPAQTYYYPAPPVPAAPAPIILLAPQQLDQLTAPIALYPDPLIAQILPAATYSLDLVTADQWARMNSTAPDSVMDAQPWEPPVKALLHYPTVLDQLAGNLAWTQQLGSAFLNQPADVMESIQRLRAQAQAAGTLVSTPQQQVIVESNTIYVIPAQPDVIYVPVYDPAVVYVRREPLRFSTGFHIGLWLDLDTDWHNHYVATGVHWDRNHWEHFHDLPLHHDEHRVEVVRTAPRPERHEWVRNPERPVYAPTPRPEPDHRFYPAPAAPSSPRGFGEYRPRPDVDHEESRGRESLHQPTPHPTPAPQPKPAPKPAPHPTPAPHAEPTHPVPTGMQPYPTQPAGHEPPHDDKDRNGRH